MIPRQARDIGSTIRSGFILICLGLWSGAAPALANELMERFTVLRGGQEQILVGKVEVQAQDGGVLLLTQDGALWRIPSEEIVDRQETQEPFRSWSADEISSRLLRELPPGFSIRKTPHYVLAYNTTPAYAHWCAGLYERVFRQYYQFWKKQKLMLPKPEFPLVAVIFEDRATFERLGQAELGPGVASVVGYYSLETNRVLMYDLTGLEELRQPGARPRTATLVREMLAQPLAAPNVATIVHEASHQLAYNSRLQTRLADNPLWLSEGLAIFFETPDFRGDKGWSRAGNFHWVRYQQFMQDLPQRPQQSLLRLITEDAHLRDPQQAAQGYAEAWALCYFLLQRHPAEFIQYLQELAEYEPLRNRGQDERLEVFQRHFGDLSALDGEFVRYMQHLAAGGSKK